MAKLPKIRSFAVVFTTSSPSGARAPGWVTVKAADFESAADWFYSHRGAMGIPLNAEVDTIRTA